MARLESRLKSHRDKNSVEKTVSDGCCSMHRQHSATQQENGDADIASIPICLPCLAQIGCSLRGLAMEKISDSPFKQQTAAIFSALRTEINNPVGLRDYL